MITHTTSKPTPPAPQEDAPEPPEWLTTAQQTQPAPAPDCISYSSKLPDSFHETMRLKLSGVPTNEIARRMGIDRTTVNRRCFAVEKEFTEHLEGQTSFSIIATEIQRLNKIEDAAMKVVDETKSDRVRDAALNTARKVIMARFHIYLKSGLVDQVPERIFQLIANFKPADFNEEKTEVTRTRQEAVSEIIEAFQKSRIL